MSKITGLSAGTVAGQARAGSGVSSTPAMPVGKKPSTMKGSRSSYLGSGVPSNVNGIAVVTAGTQGPGTGSGKNGSVTANGTSFEGRAAPTTLVNKNMKTGKKPSTTQGLRKSFLAAG